MAPGALLCESDRNAHSSSYAETAMPPANTNKHKSCSALLHRSARSTPLTLKGARGNWLKVSDDIETWEVFDGSGGASVSNIGHKQYRVMQAQWDYFDSTGIAYAPSTSLQTEIAEEFAQFMLESTNHEMAKVVFYGSGSEGNEAVCKATVQYHTKEKSNFEPDRTLFIARERSYHGATLGALGLSGHLTRREIFKPVLPINTSFISACNPYRDLKDGLTVEEYVHQLAEELENKILELGDKRVAGFIMEPVVGAALGCEGAVPGYLAAMKRICHKYGVLLILDEVMCGMGRTGFLHAWQEENVVPDVQIVGKGLAGGYANISAVLFGHKLVNAFEHGPGNGAFAHGHTFQNFPLACATGLAVQKIVRDEGLVANVREKGALLRQKLEMRLSSHRYVGNIRGKGHFQGLEFVQNKETKEPFDSLHNIAWKLHEKGLTEEYGIFIYPGAGSVDGVRGDHFIVSPAYNITYADVDLIVERVGKLVEDFFEEFDKSHSMQSCGSQAATNIPEQKDIMLPVRSTRTDFRPPE